METVKIGLVSVSDRAYNGVYEDQGLPALKEWLSLALKNPFEVIEKLIPDEQDLIEATLIELVDECHCDMVLTTGGTGPYPRDVTPDATLNCGRSHHARFRRANAASEFAFCAYRNFVAPSGCDS